MTIIFIAPSGVELSAQRWRQGHAALYGGGSNRPLGGRSGFRVDTAPDVFTATSTTWTLKPCSAMIDPGAATHQGMYGWATDANVTGSMTPADSAIQRQDRVWIQVNDSTSGDGSGAVSAEVVYQAGTPGSGAPDLPARAFLVADITVPAAGGGSPIVLVNPARFAAAGAPLPVYSQYEMESLSTYNGLTVQRRDLAGRPLYTYNGTAWITPTENISFTPESGYSFTGSLTKVTGTTGSRAQLTGRITRSTGGTGPTLTGSWLRVMTTFLPTSMVPPSGQPADAVVNLTSGLDGSGNPTIIAHPSITVKNDQSLWAKLDTGSIVWPLNGWIYVDLSWPI